MPRKIQRKKNGIETAEGVRGAIINKSVLIVSLFHVVFVGLRAVFTTWDVLPEVAEEFKLTSDDDRRADLGAFQVTCFLFYIFAGVSGGRAYYSPGWTAKNDYDKLYGRDDVAERLSTVGFSFMVWNFLVSLGIDEHSSAIMLVHHLLGGLVCWLSVKYQYLLHYSHFFLGVTEISSIFLVLVDFARFFPIGPRSSLAYSIAVEVSKPCFAFTFLWFRCVLWVKNSKDFWRAAGKARREGTDVKYREGLG